MHAPQLNFKNSTTKNISTYKIQSQLQNTKQRISHDQTIFKPEKKTKTLISTPNLEYTKLHVKIVQNTILVNQEDI
jgi:hypothetical protein